MSATNRLGRETSPYLRQHALNPVDWYAWGPEAFTAATERNVPILLSVGYSACHWCHVMAHECFEDDEVAAEMNRRFVNIKVDREERPDVDSIYMDAVQAMSGRGGWPMTVFLTPDGHPFYGGTYFPKPNFLNLMAAIDDVWVNRPDDVRQNVEALGDAIGRTALIEPAADLPGNAALNQALLQLAGSFDATWGGFGGAPKFPSTMSLDLVLRAYVRAPQDDAKTIVTTSLDAMASGGMYDHIGGGFARYSVDEKWLVPHFEKMLYDQALLIRVYLHAYLVFGEERWKQVVDETVEYVLRELRHPSGGFYSAEDADSPDEHGHGHEGLFHTWTISEVRDVLGADADIALEWYEFTEGGNFEGRTIPTRLQHRGELARPPEVESARQRLFDARAARRRPLLDDKVLTEWNGLMLASLAEAAASLDRDDWLAAAVENGRFLVDNLRGTDERWHRSWQAEGQPQARHSALAADHAAIVDGFTRLAEATGDGSWIAHACSVADTMLDHFWDVDNGGLFSTADDGEQLVARQKDLMDNATPSSNSIAAVALVRLGALTGEARYTNHAKQILRLLGRVIPQAPSAFSNAMAAVDMVANGTTEIAIVGDRPDLVRAVRSRWLPNAVLAWGKPYESPLWEHREEGFAYVCRHYACQLPADTVDTLLAQLAATA
ncbi:MAG TPA: thioredoxin domain-containing protein [Ilumatobacteraceae bacterium]|nr:thioredoxin domain-containing protein [Ilumatobacteraceae bacterium]